MLTTDHGASIELGTVLAKAGEGVVYEVAGRPEWVAKVFHPTLTELSSKLAKVAAMVGSAPAGSVQSDGFVVLTWPLQLLRSEGRPVGYVMNRIDTARSVEIHDVSNPSARADPLPGAPQWTSHVTWDHLVSIAANLCLAVAAVHRVAAVIGDFQERNILVNDTTRVSLVDCDSMQFIDAHGRRFLCGIGRPEFTAPELAGVDLRATARRQQSDLFALAVHVHLLLMGGNHPFLRGTWTGPGEQPNALALARTGDWAGGTASRLARHPLAPSVEFLPDDICRLFARAFTIGARDPIQRPTAAEWRTALLRLRTEPCGRTAHQIPTSAAACPWCAIDDERAARRRERSAAAAIGPAQEQIVHPVAVPSASPHQAPAAGSGAGATPRWAVAGMVAGAAVVLAIGALAVRAATSPSPQGASTAGSPSTSISRAIVISDLPTDRNAGPWPGTFVPVTQPPDVPPPPLITYTVTGTKAPNDEVSVTYVDATGSKRTQHNVYIPWSLTVTPISPSAIGSIKATSSLRTSQLNCSITTSDGDVVAANTNNSFSATC